jgi:hypothetical protein
MAMSKTPQSNRMMFEHAIFYLPQDDVMLQKSASSPIRSPYLSWLDHHVPMVCLGAKLRRGHFGIGHRLGMA